MPITNRGTDQYVLLCTMHKRGIQRAVNCVYKVRLCCGAEVERHNGCSACILRMVRTETQHRVSDLRCSACLTMFPGHEWRLRLLTELPRVYG